MQLRGLNRGISVKRLHQKPNFRWALANLFFRIISFSTFIWFCYVYHMSLALQKKSSTVLVRVWALFFYRLKKIKKCSFCVSQFWTPPLARLLFIFFEYGVVILDISLIFLGSVSSPKFCVSQVLAPYTLVPKKRPFSAPHRDNWKIESTHS